VTKSRTQTGSNEDTKMLIPQQKKSFKDAKKYIMKVEKCVSKTDSTILLFLITALK
jgi:hypothetical protein